MADSNGGWVAGADAIDQSGTWSNPRWDVILRWLEWLGTAVIFMTIGVILAGMADREPPFRLLEVNVPSGAPGDKIAFDAKVWRATGRHCSVTMYRSISHSNGQRVDLDPQFFSAETIDTMEHKTPDRMRPEITIPLNAAPGGDAYLSSRLRYVCNRYQTLLPIDVDTHMPFIVRAP